MDEAIIKRIPPHSSEAERAVIGSMMMDKDAILVSSEMLEPQDFYQGQYAELFQALVDLYRSGIAADVITLQDKLREMETSLDRRFFKCQRSFLVNLSHVVQIKGNCVVLKNGEEVPISRGMAEEVSRAVIALF